MCSRMSSRLVIILAVAYIVFVNARLQAVPIYLSNQDYAYNEMYADNSRQSRASFERDYPDIPIPGLVRIIEKEIEPSELLRSLAERRIEGIEAIPEQLPTPQPLASNGDTKGVDFKKNSHNYYMSLCYFKICNMGRKRDAGLFYSREQRDLGRRPKHIFG